MAQSHTQETVTSIDNILKEDYAPAIIEATRKQSATLDLIEQKAATVPYGGSTFIIPIELNSMGSTGSVAENGDLPDAMQGQWLNAAVAIKSHYFSIAVTGQAKAVTSSDKFAFASIWGRKISIANRAYRQQLNRQICGDGNAILAQVDGAPNAAVVTLDNAYGLSGYNNSDVNGTRFVSGNMKVDFYSSAGALRDSGGVTISSFTRGAFPSTSGTITVSNAADIASVIDGDYMYVAGSKGNEMSGLRLLIDDHTVATTVQGIDASAYWEWNSHVGYGSTPGTAEALTNNRMQVLMDDIESYGGGNIGFILTSPAVWLSYGEMARSENQIVNAKTLDTGWKVLEWNATQIYKDPYMVDEMYFVDPSAIAMHQAGSAGWIEGTGGNITQITSKDAFQATWAWYVNLAISNRQKCGKLVDIAVTANKQ